MSHNGKRTELVYSHGLTELQLNLQSLNVRFFLFQVTFSFNTLIVNV